MVFTFDYDTSYSGPAFPTLDVTVRNVVDEAKSATERAYIDSGADGTIIPLRVIHQINARKVDELNLRWGSGPSQSVDIFEMLLQIGSLRTLKVYAVGTKSETQILIGRDVLNNFVVTLDGIAEAVEVTG